MLAYYPLVGALAVLWGGWLIDRIIGDPEGIFHPIVAFGKAIAWCEHIFNNGDNRRHKGALVALILIFLAFMLTWVVVGLTPLWISAPFSLVMIGYCLAGKTLIKEVRDVFSQLAISLEAGRTQLSRIVGRDTSALSEEEVKTAALETLSENLSDGVIAPLFWLAILGVPGMVAYKMINTLDSMIGYRNERYADFGCFAAKVDDLANWIPSRLTALLMLAVNGKLGITGTVFMEGKNHTSPNSGYPEAALALMLGTEFGGGHYYGGNWVEKPTIGRQSRVLDEEDLKKALRTNSRAEVLMMVLITVTLFVMAMI